jgi:hypothetical protein
VQNKKKTGTKRKTMNTPPDINDADGFGGAPPGGLTGALF